MRLLVLLFLGTLAANCRTHSGQSFTSDSVASSKPRSSWCQKSSELSDRARRFLFSEDIRPESNEQHLTAIGIHNQYELIRTQEAADESHCILLMNLVMLIESPGAAPVRELSDDYVAIAMTRNGELARFEQLVPVPERIHAKIGTQGREQRSFYYAEFTGADAVEVQKSLYLKQAFCGFSAKVDFTGNVSKPSTIQPTGKASFDPTPGRTWKLRDMRYSIARGSSAEACDVNSAHFDDDFQAFVSGSNACIIPWNSCELLGISHDGGKTYRDVHLE